jgi:hypothetical protein
MMTYPTKGQYKPLFQKNLNEVMHTGLLKHLTDHILRNKQHGFKTKTKNWCYISETNKILNSLNNKLLTDCTFCDLDNEFNCVYHKTLLSKLVSIAKLMSIINFTNSDQQIPENNVV